MSFSFDDYAHAHMLCIYIQIIFKMYDYHLRVSVSSHFLLDLLFKVVYFIV